MLAAHTIQMTIECVMGLSSNAFGTVVPNRDVLTFWW
jgi:hypothetical protein